MRLPIIAAAALLALGMAACSSPPPERDSVPPPPDPTVAPAEAEGAAAGGGAVPSGPVVESISGETAAAPAAVAIPEAEGWTNPNVPLSQHQADIEACFSYASALVERDRQIDSDRALGRDDQNDNLTGLTTLSLRVDHYSEKRRRGSLFDSCMRSKGYTKI